MDYAHLLNSTLRGLRTPRRSTEDFSSRGRQALAGRVQTQRDAERRREARSRGPGLGGYLSRFCLLQGIAGRSVPLLYPRTFLGGCSEDPHLVYLAILLVARGRVQLPTFALGVRCSMQLSYRAATRSVPHRHKGPPEQVLCGCKMVNLGEPLCLRSREETQSTSTLVES